MILIIWKIVGFLIWMMDLYNFIFVNVVYVVIGLFKKYEEIKYNVKVLLVIKLKILKESDICSDDFEIYFIVLF